MPLEPADADGSVDAARAASCRFTEPAKAAGLGVAQRKVFQFEHAQQRKHGISYGATCRFTASVSAASLPSRRRENTAAIRAAKLSTLDPAQKEMLGRELVHTRLP